MEFQLVEQLNFYPPDKRRESDPLNWMLAYKNNIFSLKAYQKPSTGEDNPNLLHKHLWAFNIPTKKWTKFETIGQPPKFLHYWSATTYQNNILCLGSDTDDMDNVYSLYTLNLDTFQWICFRPGVNKAYADHVGNIMTINDELYILFGDEKNLSTITVTEGIFQVIDYSYVIRLNLRDTLPPTRYKDGDWKGFPHGVLYNNRIIVFTTKSGNNLFSFLSLYVFDMKNNLWRLDKTDPDPSSGHPEPRQLYGISQYKKFIFIIGGEGRNGKLLNDVWRLDLDRNCWKGFGNVLPVDTTPESLGWHLSTITEDDYLYVFGGAVKNRLLCRTNLKVPIAIS